ncbi:MAG: polysaccharide ABC transporter ATP-binding protein [Gemmatimonadaceae bacterium]
MSEHASTPVLRGGETPGIIFDHVWKKFRRGEVHDSLRDLIPALGKRLTGRGPRKDDLVNAGDFWALRDVSFSVQPGQALGVIGANGAGKSTVLKTLTKILRPTRGFCEVRGRVGALIEIAAGFHQDLTGRENVFLQGAIMGMRRVEIARKFDEIVDFAGVGEFIDTPVKRYSSGMNARLGFSIAAHLDPDVLIIDEVLAVGDVKFQQKAYDRIQRMVKSGIPVVIVSHQLDRIVSLCTDCILLHRGAIARQGTPAECVAAYATEGTAAEENGDQGVANDPIVLHAARVDGAATVRSGDWTAVVATGTVRYHDPTIEHSIAIGVRAAHSGERVYWTTTSQCHVPLPPVGDFEMRVDLQANLPPGVYTIETAVWNETTENYRHPGPNAQFQVVPADTNFKGVAQMNPRFDLQPGADTLAQPRLVVAGR